MTPSAPPSLGRRTVARRLAGVAVLAICLLTVVLAVPDLRPALHDVREMDPVLVLVAVGLEIASCLSFVSVFRLFFPSVPKRSARELAWTQMGAGALLPGGGVGSLAAGGWLLHLAGMSRQEIVRRSSGLFFLTSAINVLALGLAGALLLLHLGHGPADVLRGGLPVLAAVAAVVGTLCLPALARRVAAGHRRVRWIEDLGQGIPDARQALARPSWGLLGATGYLLFDIAVLWVCLAAVGPAPSVAALVVAYLVGYLGNAVPIPGGVGVLDAGLVGALALYGLPLDHAAAGVLVYHALAFWIPGIGGTAAYARLRPYVAGHPNARRAGARTVSVGRTRLTAENPEANRREACTAAPVMPKVPASARPLGRRPAGPPASRRSPAGQPSD